MHVMLRFLVASLVAWGLVIVACESDARAQYVVVRRQPQTYGVGLNLGLDIEGATDVTPPPGASIEGGGGFKLRVGAEIRRPYLRIIPEGGFAYTHLFVTDAAGDDLGWNMERLFGGVRIGFGEIIVPIIYAHIGYGWRAANDNNGNVVVFPSANGFTADGGVGLDFHLIRHVGFGFHAEYVTVQAAPAVPDWVAFGAHADFRF
jgi:hypothetical protein